MFAGVFCAGFAVTNSFAQLSEAESAEHMQADSGQKESAQADQALAEIRRSISLSRERMATLADEVARLEKDRKHLGDAQVEAARTERSLSADIRDREGRFKALMVKRGEAEKKLLVYRAEFSQVLGVAERIGRNPPPALLVHPQDALQSVRSAALLGAIVPDMRERTQILSAAFQELAGMTKAIEEERGHLVRLVEAQQSEQQRLKLLLAEKSKLQQKSASALAKEQAHNEELIKRAQSLQELLAELDRHANGEAGQDSALQLRVQTDLAALQGRLMPPVDGRRVRAFGGAAQGESYETAPGAVVTSPVEGIVRYAGAFRSYGRLLIIDAGHNYHIILAGLGRIDVARGQLLLQGEPVGAMDTQIVASAGTFDIGKTTQMLYIEMRKDGKPVNPSLWWLRR